jgi:hypothetical protein
MVGEGVVAAQYIQSWSAIDQDAVLLAPAYTFLMMNRPVDDQFWIDVGSTGWYERLYQPLTHPYVLSRRWQPNTLWTDADENAANQETLARLTGGLAMRCRHGIFLCVNGVNEQGDEQRGPLLYALQAILRQLDLRIEGGE